MLSPTRNGVRMNCQARFASLAQLFAPPDSDSAQVEGRILTLEHPGHQIVLRSRRQWVGIFPTMVGLPHLRIPLCFRSEEKSVEKYDPNLSTNTTNIC